MNLLSLLLVLPAADPDDSLAKKMLPIYVTEVVAYSIAVESAPTKTLELKKEPVFDWANPARDGGQQGSVFLWLRDGRPAALACIFSHPHDKLPGRKINHELHALDPEKLVVKRDAYNEWKPQAGLARSELPDSGAPAATAGARLVQMKRLAHEFGGYEVDRERKRWELRLLPTPLYRYPLTLPSPPGGEGDKGKPSPPGGEGDKRKPSPPGGEGRVRGAKTGVVDGALFALVSNAGTDPEVLLLIEAKEVDGKLRWEYACGRFSDWELRVLRKDKEVWSSVPSETNPPAHDPLHIYRLYPEKVVTTEGKLLARFRQTPKIWWGELIPVNDK